MTEPTTTNRDVQTADDGEEMIDCIICNDEVEIDGICPACDGSGKIPKSLTERSRWPEMAGTSLAEWTGRP